MTTWRINEEFGRSPIEKTKIRVTTKEIMEGRCGVGGRVLLAEICVGK
jgi:hypothetical protein